MSDLNTKMNKIKRQAQALIELSELCDKNQVYILPRWGLLLGVIRHQGFLPNEDVDLDVTAHVDDVEKIKSCDWGDFIIEFDDYYLNGSGKGAYCKPGRVGNSFFNDHHPISKQKISPSRISITRKGEESILRTLNGPLMYNYKPGYIALPNIYMEGNYRQEILLNEIYHEKWGYETGPRMLGVEEETPLTSAHLELKKDDKGWGTIATKYKSSDVFPVRKAKFYDSYIHVHGNAEEVLKQHYGKDCLEVMITKKAGFMNSVKKDGFWAIGSDCDTDPRVKL
jgi:hypothetical protein